jgi:arabinogalactan endo-1,4-beta-galactosidase
MKKLAGLFLLGMAGLALTGFSGRTLAATECNTKGGPQNGATPLSGTLVGGVVVNAGDICFLSGANISGGVRVNEGGELYVCASTINGGVIANGAAEIVFGAEEIDCAGDLINGAVQISNTGPGALAPAPSIALERSTINGGVHLSGNRGPIAVATNRIAGPLLCSNNAFDLEDEGSPSLITGAVRCKFGD